MTALDGFCRITTLTWLPLWLKRGMASVVSYMRMR